MSMFNFDAFTDDFEDFELPDRHATKYTEVEDFADNELSNNMAYELGSRNEEVQHELEKFITYEQQHKDVTPEYKEFNYKRFFEYGFDEAAMNYLLFRKEALNYEETQNLSHDELCKFCKSCIDYLGRHFDDAPNVILLQKYRMVEDYLNHGTCQKISCRFIEIDNEIYNILPFDGSYYDQNSDNPYNLTESSKNNYLFKKGLYIYKDDVFDRKPLPLWHKSYDEIMPTIALNYSRPIMKNPYMNKHIYTLLNFNLEDEEILENVKRMIKISKSKDNIDLKQNILNASELFFEEYKLYKKPKNLKKNELQVYYANMLYAYDTMKLFDKYLIDLDQKYKEGLKEIKSEKNRLETDAQMRKAQKRDLDNWKNDRNKKKTVHDEIYVTLFNEEFAPDGSHQVNTLLGLAKKLIDNKQYRFLI